MSLIPWRSKRREDEAEYGREMVPIDYFRREIDRLFDRFFGGEPMPITEGFAGWGRWMPSVDVTETEKEILVRAELAGVDPKDVDISVSGQVLSLSGEKKESAETKDENCCVTERRFGSFKRTIQLPAPVDTEHVSAEHKHGVIMIRLKKQSSAIPKRIEVKSGQ